MTTIVCCPLFLQLKERKPNPERFGQLVKPNAIGKVQSHAELAEYVRGYGSATVQVYTFPGWTVEREETLTPEEFNAQWIGD